MPCYISFLLEYVFPYFTFNLIPYVFLGMPLNKLHRAGLFYIQPKDVAVIYYYIKNYPRA